MSGSAARQQYEAAIAFSEARHEATRARRHWLRVNPSKNLADGFDITQGIGDDQIIMTVTRAELAAFAHKAAHIIATTD